MTEILQTIAKVAKVELKTKQIPLSTAKMVSKIQGWQYNLFGKIPTLSATSIAIMGSGQHLDGSKAKRELGFEASTSLEEGFQKAYNWFSKMDLIRGNKGGL